VSLTEDALAIAFRTGLPFVGLRDHFHDPDLDRLIPPDAARAARAIPLTADDDRIRLAVADPDTDLSTLDKYLAGRQVDLALAPREEIDTILGPPPPPGEVPPEELAHGSEAIATEEPEPAPAEPEGPESLTEVEPEPERLAAAEDADPTEATPSESAPEPVGETAPQPEPLPVEPDPLAAEPEDGRVAEPEPVAAVVPADHAALSDSDAELDGELPSWLEPRRRRWWRVLLAVLLVLVVLAAAAVAVVALVNA
jgi:MshEN domain